MKFASALTLLSTTACALASTHFHGVVASNAESGSTNYNCRTQDDWNNIANQARINGFRVIRIEGFDCNSLQLASAAAAANGVQVMAGIYIPGAVADSITDINNQVQDFKNAYAQYGSGLYVGLTIGNEVNDSSGNIMAKVYDVRGYLQSVGVNTPVSTVHTWVRIINDAALCGADFVGANAHAYYDGGQTSGQAGSFLFNIVVPRLQAACPGKAISITETGWPSAGGNNGVAVASPGDQTNALSTINCAAAGNPSVSVYAFEYDDQQWKSAGVEQNFGIWGKVDVAGTFSVC